MESRINSAAKGSIRAQLFKSSAKVKGGKNRHLPLHPGTHALIHEYLGRALNVPSINLMELFDAKDCLIG